MLENYKNALLISGILFRSPGISQGESQPQPIGGLSRPSGSPGRPARKTAGKTPAAGWN
jgi:hypothetical protein